jgi:hypothetical protein
MDTKLNANGQANLLPNLKQDLSIKSHNYLREYNQKNKKNRTYLKRESSNEEDDDYIRIVHHRVPAN